MPEINFLFRFRDLIAPTLSEHKKIIDDKGECWWGWWKRPSEGARLEIWDALEKIASKKEPVPVGLFDSGSGKVFKAYVTAVKHPVIRDDETVDCTTNGDADCSGSPGGPCGFAGYRDWEIPNVKLLQSIVDYSVFSASSSVPGATRASGYWSSTTGANFAFGPNFAWSVAFNFGVVSFASKLTLDFARAVRPCS